MQVYSGFASWFTCELYLTSCRAACPRVGRRPGVPPSMVSGATAVHVLQAKLERQAQRASAGAPCWCTSALYVLALAHLLACAAGVNRWPQSLSVEDGAATRHFGASCHQ